ncbi:hypothetical protein SAMN06295974_3720 [Plantibacter flavus]|uniref:Uncharacterized protein n=1 Tax=Plantibacter flavus TaxID=150123 RepID=A0A3N2BLT5_9MICO|nr:hypothetical protein [Plantibacter flavus]ROR76132.1 hypothetical protein EDD42_4085 [Plantibacter flavus]SMG48348.1 hypothetical protein SAMN06295974_3720 [Plantibacter flavus]
MTSTPAPTPVVRIKLGEDRPAPSPDALGRTRIGFLPGLAPVDLWERGRGVWKASLPNVAAAELALLVANGVVVAVGTIDGVFFVSGGRIAINGEPDPLHPLIGQPDPLANGSQNPIAYGIVNTVPAVPAAVQRSYEAVLTDAIDVLTEAARLRRPRLQPSSTGRWEPHPDDSEPSDWAEFVTLALAGAAANVGGIETALRGRPGSWEAAGVRSLLESTVGTDEGELMRHRTAPVHITLNIDEILTEHGDTWQQYDAAADEIGHRLDEAAVANPEIPAEEYVWVYDTQVGADPTPRSPEAPAWSWDAWQNFATRSGATPAQIENIKAGAQDGTGGINVLYVAKSDVAGDDFVRLSDERDAHLEAIVAVQDELDKQRDREFASYAEALSARIVELARETVTAEVHVHLDGESSSAGANEPVVHEWIRSAVEAISTPADLPGTPLERLPLQQASA